MNLRYKTLNILSSILILLFIGAIKLQAAQLETIQELSSISPPMIAPTLKLKSLDGNEVNIKSLKGKVVIVNFWATWCPPCRLEIPSLARMYLKIKSKNIVILAVNIGEDSSTVSSYLNNLNPTPTFTTLLDTNMKVTKKWGVIAIPTTFIVNKKGKIVYKAMGGRNYDNKDIVDIITKLVSNNKIK